MQYSNGYCVAIKNTNIKLFLNFAKLTVIIKILSAISIEFYRETRHAIITQCIRNRLTKGESEVPTEQFETDFQKDIFIVWHFGVSSAAAAAACVVITY